MVEQVLQIGGANVHGCGPAVGQALGLKVGAHEHMPLQGSGYGVKEPPQGLLAATVLVELERAPDGRAGALLEVGDVGRKADSEARGQVGKCLGDEVVAVGVHGSMVRMRCSKGIAEVFSFVLYLRGAFDCTAMASSSVPNEPM